MSDEWESHAPTQESPVRSLVAVTPHDSTDLTDVAKALYVGGAGDIAILCPGASAAVVLADVAAGSILPIQVQRVDATNTTATSIVALID